ncbi:MAG: C40 family peptidase, partial [Ignavibacteriae bacterium]|nr:C40 family peptidase [Ignavibacteriota bacterium]
MFLLFACEGEKNMDNIKTIIENVKQEVAPDKRTAIFDVDYLAENNKIKLSGETTEPEALEKLNKSLAELGMEIENNVKVLPDENLGDKHFGIINLSVANIRSKPSHPAELATQSLLGTCVNVLKKDDGWYQIQTPDKYISWVDDDALAIVDENESQSWKDAKKIVYTKAYGQVFSKTNLQGQKVSDIVIGDLLKNISEEGQYLKVEYPDGREGFVKKENCLDYNKWASDSVATGGKIISSASEYLGLPYLWGGTSSKGFDCSGFTKTVYFQHGVILPRDASQQVLVGELVNTDQNFNGLQKGDLLFFGRKKTETERERVSHVAIYLGDNKYIHAAGRVRINSLDKKSEIFNQYRLNTFIRAKRMIGSYNKGENLV